MGNRQLVGLTVLVRVITLAMHQVGSVFVRGAPAYVPPLPRGGRRARAKAGAAFGQWSQMFAPVRSFPSK